MNTMGKVDVVKVDAVNIVEKADVVNTVERVDVAKIVERVDVVKIVGRVGVVAIGESIVEMVNAVEVGDVVGVITGVDRLEMVHLRVLLLPLPLLHPPLRLQLPHKSVAFRCSGIGHSVDVMVTLLDIACLLRFPSQKTSPFLAFVPWTLTPQT